MITATLLSRLQSVRRTATGRWIARCPAHDDRRATLCVSELDDGRVLVHCFAGCATEHVLAALGLDFSDLFPPRHGRREVLRSSPFRAADVLKAVTYEALVVYFCADTLERGRSLNVRDRQRLRLAVSRLQHAAAVVHGG